jgi:hypothetical protein
MLGEKLNGKCCSGYMTSVVRSIHQVCYEHQHTHLVKLSIWKSMISGKPLVTAKWTSPLLQYNVCCNIVTVLQSAVPQLAHYRVTESNFCLCTGIPVLHRQFKVQTVPTSVL